jgi:hypothetical protein
LTASPQERFRPYVETFIERPLGEFGAADFYLSILVLGFRSKKAFRIGR